MLKKMKENHRKIDDRLQCCICGPMQNTSFFCVKDGYEYLKCKNCGMVFLNKDRKIRNDFYNHVQNNIDDKKKHEIEYWSFPELYQKYQDVFEHFFKDRLNQIKKAGYNGGALLDIGCGYGLFLKFCKDQGLDVTGIETGEKQVAWAKENYGLDVRLSSVESYKPERLFNVAVMTDVLEHVEKPEKVLLKIACHLKPGGLIAVQVPYHIGIRLPPRHSWGVPHHLWQFSRKTLESLLVNTGFETVSVSTGVLGVIGMLERGGLTIIEKIYIWMAKYLRTGNRLFIIAKKIEN